MSVTKNYPYYYHIGYSQLNAPIEAYEFGPKNKSKILILGGIHGDETEGVTAALGLLSEFTKNYSFDICTTLIPRSNPDGVLLKTRSNFNGVDLNRNLPTQDWTSEVKNPRYNPGPQPLSEPENKALIAWLELHQPLLIISLHSWYPVLNVNGPCLKQAQAISQMTGYKIDTDIGYPTPGSLGTFAGLERNMPTLTYEIERGLSLEEVLKVHVPAVIQAIEVTMTE